MPEHSPIDRSSPRSTFELLVGRALGENRVRSSPLASGYLVDLLCAHVRPPAEPRDRRATLAEDWHLARRERGAERLRRLRALGDRALFISGFFGDSLRRKVVDLDYYGEVGSGAYANLSSALSGMRDATWPELFGELAARFRDFADVLAEVGDRSRHEPSDLLRIYERWVLTGSERDRRRLLDLGCVPPPRGARGVLQ